VANEGKGQNEQIGVNVRKGTNVTDVTIEDKKGAGPSKGPGTPELVRSVRG
jgi:hypothetical protein